MPPSGDATRAALIEAATRLFADQGVDGPSIEAIVRAAGARNSSAVSYHFGGRAQLLQAVLAHHQGPIEEHRRRLLARLDPDDHALENLARVTIEPLIEHLAAPGGAEYLRIRAELLSRGDLDAEILKAPQIVEAAGPIDLGAAGRFAHHQRELVTAMLFGGLADFARRHPQADASERRAFGALLGQAMVTIGQLSPEAAVA